MNTFFDPEIPSRKFESMRHRKSLLISALVIALFAAMAFVKVSAADSTAPQAHSDGVVAALEDTAITAKIKAKFVGKKGLEKSDINVKTTNGVVTLAGTAATANAKTLAEKIAKSVDGVKHVDNDLVTPSDNALQAKTKAVAAKTGQMVSDSWITTKVKSEIVGDSVNKGLDVNVKTYDGVVKLTGTVANRDAANHVKSVAERVEGVKSVDTSQLIVATH